MANALRFLSILGFLLVGPSASAEAAWTFTDVTAAAQITHTHGWTAPFGDEYVLCGGVASGDYDDDGWIDLFVVRGDVGPNLLYRNKGDGTFEDKAAFAEVDDTMLGCGATFADYDGDGDLDLLVTGFDDEPSKFYSNDGDGTFTDVSANFPLTRKNNLSASFADYDRDGDLDAFVTHWTLPKISHRTVDEHLWRNDSGTFVDVGQAAGITAHPLDSDTDKTFTPNFTDIDDDGWLDLLLVADFGDTQVFVNDGDGTFTNVTNPSVITDQNGMGSAICDYDFDGDMDWFVTSIFNTSTGGNGNRMYRNQDGLGNFFEDQTTATGTREGYWGWGASCQDFDNDGDVDIFHVNGYDNAPSQNDPARLFVSNGAAVFTEESAARNIDDTGRGLGVVSFDYDRDGDLDIFITNNQAAPKLYRNDGLSQNYLTVKLDGLAPNTESIGSRVLATVGGTTMVRELRAGNNFISQDPAEAHFGLASATQVDTLEVRWFNGGSTTMTNVPANQVLTIVEPTNTCGDGTVDAGEQCDEGALNGGASCCQVNCRIRPSGATCRGEGGLCDVAEVCDGVSTTCPADGFATAGTECRAVADVCDVAETCTGASAACPTDAFEPASTECRASAGVCDVADTCTGSDAACPVDEKSTAECRSEAGLCDVAEVCDGVNDDCPIDGFALPGTECRAAAGICDLAELCDGLGATCPGDAKSTDVCRNAADVCDLAESCDGVGNDCPTDGFVAGGTECRATAGDCDVAEACTGASPSCPADGFVAGGTECRPSAAICDVAEACTGASATCPDNGFQSAGTECRAAADVCDAAETCTGASPSCPVDGFQSAGTECRAATDACDAVETCTGAGIACPADGFLSAGTECRAAADVCDVAETCSGSSSTCPADGFASASTECRAAAGVCDLAETCTGSGTACPSDAKSTAECRAAAGVCDLAESCDGVGNDCPADVLDGASECRAAAGVCDVAESCNGLSPDCPTDLLVPAGTECRSSAEACDVPEDCDGFDSTCPVDTGLPDGDADGTCDALDVCPETPDPAQLDDDADGLGNECDACTALQATTVTGPNLKLVKLTRGAGEQRMKLKGYVTLPPPITPALDPTTHGTRFVMGPRDDPRNPVLDVTIPGGAYDKVTKEGWVASPTGLVHKFKSKAGVEGITKILLKTKDPGAGLVQFIVVAKDADFPFLESDLPLALTMTINDVAGQCAEYEFELEPHEDPACQAKSGGDKILCK